VTDVEKEIKVAQSGVESSTQRLDQAFDHLREKVDEGAQRFERIRERIMAPVNYVRRHPTEFASLAAFVASVFLGRIVAQRFPARRRPLLLRFIK
jgi:hypothetical protein